jgi:nucleoside-diphosphate-sugar epimerase
MLPLDDTFRTFFGDRKILVTGASGFIGRRLCERLRDAGAEVHGVSRQEQSPERGLLEWHRADLADADVAQALVLSVAPDTVFHLASEVCGDPGHERVGPMLESNLLGTVNVLTAVQEAGCRRMVMTGTVVEPRDGDPATSPYAAAKGAATEHARMFHSLYGTPVVCLRLAMVYGPGQSNAHKLIPHVITSLLRGEAPGISSGRWEVDWVYVDDVVEALMLAAISDGVEGQILDVGSGDVASVRSVVERLAGMVDVDLGPNVGVVEDRPLERSVSTNLAQTRESLGWVPATSLQDGLRETVHWFRKGLPGLLFALDAAVGAL